MKMHPTGARQSYHRDMTRGGHYLRIRNRREADLERWREREERFGVPAPMDAGEKERIRRHKLAYEWERTRAQRLQVHKKVGADGTMDGKIEVYGVSGTIYVNLSGQPKEMDRLLEELEEAVREAREDARKRLEAFDGRTD